MFGLNKYKKVTHSDGTVQFQVPKSWIEELEEDGSLVLWDEAEYSGTLRFTLLTAKKENESSPNPAVEFLGPKDPNPVLLENNNALRYYTSNAEENGEPIKLFHYEVANYVEPKYYRLALFTFITYSAHEDKKDIQKQLKCLEQEIPKTVFSPVVQEWER